MVGERHSANARWASGRAQVNLTAAGQRAMGGVTLSRGQLASDLTSDLAGLAVRMRALA